jgi:hypothetical protein
MYHDVRVRITRLLLIGALSLGSYAAAQISGCFPEPHTLPDDLRSTLEARLATFLTAQAQGHWDEVADLLGSKTFVHESSYKQCLVSRIQELRMVSFDLFTPDLYTCTTQIELPAGTVDRLTAERLPWYVRGMARFQTSSETWMQETQVRAYRDQGQWYFVPPQENMQDKWEKVHYTDTDFARDRQEEIEIRNSLSSPIEITDVHVYMDRKFPSLRNIDFKLRNKTAKKVIGLRMRIGDESGATDWGGPYQIEPRGYLAHEEDVSAYGDFCAGIRKHPMVVVDVSFADGSKWELKSPGNQKGN